MYYKYDNGDGRLQPVGQALIYINLENSVEYFTLKF